jgi:hypothetical protein
MLTAKFTEKRGTNAGRHGYDPTRKGLLPCLGFGAYSDSGAMELRVSFGTVVNTHPIFGDTTCGFNYPNILSASMGARGCGGMCR